MRDTGAGIAQENLDKVFDMFAQVGLPHGRTQAGLGPSPGPAPRRIRIAEINQRTASQISLRRRNQGLNGGS